MSNDAGQARDTSHIQHLLELRSQLGDATRWATQAGPLQLTTAVVLLDGVVERALYIAAASRGVNPDAKKQFDGLHGAVRDALGSDWKPPAWNHILQLHRARNGAQHAGLAPNADALRHWINAVGAFTRWLVETADEVDLDTVVLTDAVQDAELRRTLEGAAAALAARDAIGCVTRSLQAVDAAEGRWSRALSSPSRGSFGVFSPARRVETGHGEAAHVQAELKDLRRQVRLATFSQDPAEVAWFARLKGEQSHVDLDDADRALAFASSWVLGFEAAMSGWTHDRRARTERLARRVRNGNGPAYLADAVAAHSPRGVVATFTIIDVPNRDFDAWRDTAHSLWRELRGAPVIGGGVWADGTASVQAATFEDLEPDVRLLGRALALADARLASDRAEEAARDLARREAQDRFAQALESAGALPDWVASVELEREGSAVRVRVTEAQRWLAKTAAREAAELGAPPGTELSVASGNDAFQMMAPVEPTLVAATLWAMDPQVQRVAREGLIGEQWLALETENLRQAVQAIIDEIMPSHGGERA